MEQLTALTDALKSFISTLTFIGYDYKPTLVAIAIIILGRERWVRPLPHRRLSKDIAMALHDKYKRNIMRVSLVCAYLMTLAVSRPATWYDNIFAGMWAFIHSAVAHVLYSYLSSKKFMKKLGDFVPKAEVDAPDGEEGV